MPPSPLFFIAELLEAILLKIDPHTLLISAMRVCRFWNRVILHSDRLQTILFFKPYQGSIGLPRHNNPYLERLWSQIFLRRDFSTLSYPFLSKSLRSKLVPQQIDVYLRPEASWRRMLIYQPASTSWEVQISVYRYYCTYRPHIYLKPPTDGSALLGTLYSLIRKKVLFPGRKVFTFRRGRLVCKPLDSEMTYRVMTW